VSKLLPKFETLGIHYEWFLFFTLIIAFVPYVLLIKRHFKLFNAWIFFIAFYGMVAIASVYWSTYSYDMKTMRELFRSVIVPLCISMFALNIFEEKQNVYSYIRHFIIASFLLSLVSIYQILSGVGVMTTDLGAARAVGTLNNPNALAIFLVLSIPCILYAIEKRMFPKMIGLIIAASVVAGVISTVSRKGIVTMVLAFFLYYLLQKKFKKVLVVGAIFVLISLMVSGYAMITDRFAEKALNKDFISKKNMAYAGWVLFKKSPLIGTGYRGYYENFWKSFPKQHLKKFDAHNMYVTALSDYGLIGFMPFIAIFIYPLLASFKDIRAKPHIGDVYTRDMGIICIVSILPFMISGYFAGGLIYEYVYFSIIYSNAAIVLSGHNIDNSSE